MMMKLLFLIVLKKQSIKINSISQKQYNTILEKGQKTLWNKNTVYHEWNKILPQIDSEYQLIDPMKIIKKYHNEYYKG